jgi:hypothetical protein
MELHLRCLYRHDETGRIVTTRQPGGWASPLFHLGRTRLGNLWRFRNDLDSSVVRDLARLAGREPPLQPGASLSGPGPGQGPEPERLEAIRRLLGGDNWGLEQLSLEQWCGPAFRFPRQLPVPEGPLPLVEITPDRAELLCDSFSDWISELAERQPCVAVVENGRAVSLCCPSRPQEVPGSPACAAAEAGVETRLESRGEGHASRVVAAWARLVRDRGGEPIYSTSWENRASRAVAHKLGLVLYGEDLHLSSPPAGS